MDAAFTTACLCVLATVVLAFEAGPHSCRGDLMETVAVEQVQQNQHRKDGRQNDVCEVPPAPSSRPDVRQVNTRQGKRPETIYHG